MRRAEKKYHNCAPAHVTGTRSLFLELSTIILTYKQITLDEFCMLVLCKFGKNRRRVRLLAWLTLLPDITLLPVN